LNDRDQLLSRSQSNHRFRKQIQVLLVIIHPLCGCMHVVSPPVILILFLPRRSYQSNDLPPQLHPCWIIRDERIFSVKWTSVNPVALCPGALVVALCQI